MAACAQAEEHPKDSPGAGGPGVLTTRVADSFPRRRQYFSWPGAPRARAFALTAFTSTAAGNRHMGVHHVRGKAGATCEMRLQVCARSSQCRPFGPQDPSSCWTQHPRGFFGDIAVGRWFHCCCWSSRVSRETFLGIVISRVVLLGMEPRGHSRPCLRVEPCFGEESKAWPVGCVPRGSHGFTLSGLHGLGLLGAPPHLQPCCFHFSVACHAQETGRFKEEGWKRKK